MYINVYKGIGIYSYGIVRPTDCDETFTFRVGN